MVRVAVSNVRWKEILLVPPWDGLPGELGVPGGPEGPWPLEVDRGPHFLDPGSMGALHDLLLDLLGLLDLPGWGLLGGGLVILGLGSRGLLGHGLLLAGVFSCQQ